MIIKGSHLVSSNITFFFHFLRTDCYVLIIILINIFTFFTNLLDSFSFKLFPLFSQQVHISYQVP